MSADRILKLQMGLNGTPIPVGAASGGGSIDGEVGFDNLSFGQSSGKRSYHFTSARPSSDRIFGELGRLLLCKAGDTIYMDGALYEGETIKIMSEVPSDSFGSLSNIIGTLSQTEDNNYTIPSNLENAVCAFFPARWTSFYASALSTLDSDGQIVDTTMFAGYTARQLCPLASLLNFDLVPSYVQRYLESESFWINQEYNKALYASLFVAASDLVGAKVAIMGDSLTQQSAGSGGTSSITGYINLYLSGDGWASRFARKYMLSGIVHGVGQQMWWSSTNLPDGATTAVRRLIDSDYIPNFIILEYGTNDIWSAPNSFGAYEDTASETATTTAGAMRWCIETLQAAYPSAKILVIMPCMHNGANGLPPAAQATYYTLANKILDDYAIKRVDMAHESGIVKAMGNSDGVHLATKDGNYYINDTVAVEKYSRAIEKALLSL